MINEGDGKQVMQAMTRTMRVATMLVVTLLLGACSASVVREVSPTGAGAGRPASVPRPGVEVAVQRGDTLYGIAFRNGIDFRDLASWNRIVSPYTIYPGQRLRLYPGAAVASSTRPSGSAATPAPRPSTPRPASTPAPSVPPPVASGFRWAWPADGQVIGRFVAGDASKQGVDIGGASGQPVRAAADGVVVYSGAGLVGYGELVIIKHSEAWLSAYGHNRKRLVNEGQSVRSGQQIAEMGRSGAARDMLHFEIRYNGKPVDPLQYLPPR